jgi:hypothetical protein
MFGDGGVPSPRQTAEWVVRSAAVLEWVAGEAAGGGRGNQQAFGGQPGVRRIPMDSCPAQAPRSALRSHDSVASHAPTWVAGVRSAPARDRGNGTRGRCGCPPPFSLPLGISKIPSCRKVRPAFFKNLSLKS